MMTCRDAIDWLLEAAPSELRTPGSHELAEHLAACEGCRTRLARIVGDSAWLAQAVSAPSALVLASGSAHLVPSRSRWKGPSYMGTALAAAALLMVFLSRDPRPGRSDSARAWDRVVVSTASRASTDSVVNVPTRIRGQLLTHGQATAHSLPSPERASRLPAARAVEAVALAPAPVLPMTTHSVRIDTLSSDNESGRMEPRASFAIDANTSTGRYAVLRSTPKLTVVWFY